MERVEVALDDDLAGDLASYARAEHVAEGVAAERLLADALGKWRRERAVERFAGGDVAFAAAAAEAGLELDAFAELLHDLDLDWVDADRAATEVDG